MLPVNIFLVTLVVIICCPSYGSAGCDRSATSVNCSKELGSNSTNLVPVCLSSPECAAVSQSCNTSLSANTTYGVLCTVDGIQFYPSNSWCGMNNSDINTTTSAFCREEGNSLNCIKEANGMTFLPDSTVTRLIRRKYNCDTSFTTPKSGNTSPSNPVGPEAITAIVVVVCLFISAVLAGLFFWPKCHIADPAAYALKKATKPASAKAATKAAYAASSAETAGGVRGSSMQTEKSYGNVQLTYQLNKKAAIVSMPSA